MDLFAELAGLIAESKASEIPTKRSTPNDSAIPDKFDEKELANDQELNDELNNLIKGNEAEAPALKIARKPALNDEDEIAQLLSDWNPLSSPSIVKGDYVLSNITLTEKIEPLSTKVGASSISIKVPSPTTYSTPVEVTHLDVTVPRLSKVASSSTISTPVIFPDQAQLIHVYTFV
jgi:hypothetical protein